jgi:hypothetical protein
MKSTQRRLFQIQNYLAGGFAPLGEYKSSWIFKQLEIIGENLASN